MGFCRGGYLYPMQGGAAVYRALQGFTGALCAVGRGAAVQRREEGRKKGRRRDRDSSSGKGGRGGGGTGYRGKGRKRGSGAALGQLDRVGGGGAACSVWGLYRFLHIVNKWDFMQCIA